MVRTTALVAATAALALNAHAEGLYSKKSAVTQITGMDYDRVIANSNYTSIIEFYAPWCGHCKNLKPAYEAAAKSLAGIAKVAAVNCDEEMNKPFCGRMGVQGFPTLKIVRPSKKPGKPTVEDYQGGRTAKAIVDAVKDKVPNSVKRVNDKNLDSWLDENKDNAKAILFSDKGLVSATLRALAIDFAGLVSVAQIKKSEGNAVEKFGIEDFPSLILLPAGSEKPIKYDGEMQKEGMVKFLSQIAPPNPDCPPPKEKKSKAKKDTKKDKKDEKKEKKFSKSSAAHKESEASSAAASGKDETIEEANKPTESPSPNDEDTPKPVEIPEKEAEPTIPILSDPVPLHVTCLNDKSKTCIIALLPKDETSEDAKSAIASLASIHKKHDARASNLFPFIAVPASNPLSSTILAELSLGTDDKVHLIATHGKRAWYKKYAGTTFGAQDVEAWVDAIRMGEGKKEKLPDAVIASDATPPAEEKRAAEEEPIKIEVEELPDDTPEHGEL